MDVLAIGDIAAAVFIGNVMTLAAYHGIKRLLSVERGIDAPWWALVAVLLPVGFAVLGLIAAGS